MRWSTLMKASPGCGVRPSTVIGPHAIIWLSGSDETPPTAVTPGSADSRDQISPVRVEHGGGVAVLLPGHRQFERQDVGGVEPRRHLLEADEASDQQPRAHDEHHRQRQLAHDERAAEALTAAPPGGGARSARGVLERVVHGDVIQTPHRHQAEEQARHQRGGHREEPARCRRWQSREAAARCRRRAAGCRPGSTAPAPGPARRPAPASSRLSVSICRDSRHRLAPMAARTASSRCRPMARASSRFATFTQATSNTMPTAATRTTSACRTSPTTYS